MLISWFLASNAFRILSPSVQLLAVVNILKKLCNRSCSILQCESIKLCAGLLILRVAVQVLMAFKGLISELAIRGLGPKLVQSVVHYCVLLEFIK